MPRENNNILGGRLRKGRCVFGKLPMWQNGPAAEVVLEAFEIRQEIKWAKLVLEIIVFILLFMCCDA